MFEATDTNFALRRKIMNRVLISLFVIVTIIGAFEFGQYWVVKDTFIQPHHFQWNGFCGFNGGDQVLCSCMEKEMVKDFGRDPAKSKNHDQTIMERALITCRK
jgi:hypothetical protein